jgi:hypothetical protein
MVNMTDSTTRAPHPFAPEQARPDHWGRHQNASTPAQFRAKYLIKAHGGGKPRVRRAAPETLLTRMVGAR